MNEDRAAEVAIIITKQRFESQGFLHPLTAPENTYVFNAIDFQTVVKS